MRAIRGLSALAGAAIAVAPFAAHGADLAAHAEVDGVELDAAELRPEGGAWRAVAWSQLARTSLDPGRYELRLPFATTETAHAVQIPPCAGRARVRLDSRTVAAPAGPVVISVAPGNHDLTIEVDVSRYERRVACGEPPRVGVERRTIEGLGVLSFDSPYGKFGRAERGGKAVVYVPPGRELRSFTALLVGLHPWNGNPWTYAAYEELLREARALGVLLLMPSGLGNSLYTAEAEDEVLLAIDALTDVVSPTDTGARIHVSVWGASMGGAGATTIAFHHPDRFVLVTSFFGDSRYDVATYVRTILPDAHAAHVVNALDVVDNARNLPVWLIHGEADATSPIRQSAMLADALRERGFAVRFDRVPGVGHAGALVARFLPQVVAAAATKAPPIPARVTYRSVSPAFTRAYGIRIDRASPLKDAFIDVERLDDGVHVRQADGVHAIVLDPGALGTSPERPPRLMVDDPGSAVTAAWAMHPPWPAP